MKQLLMYSLICCLVTMGVAHGDNLYDEQSYRPIASDKRAHLPGDAITIMIYENSSASTSADTNVQRANTVGLQGAADSHAHQASIGTNTTFDGGGTVARSGNLLAQITATVTKLAPNGDLWISGEQIVEINSDKQHIKVEGRVRLMDVSESNTVPSNRIADAQISYLGDGDLASHQKPSWLSRFFAWAGL